MLNSLDLLIIVAMVLVAASLLSLVLMFLVKNKTVRRVCLYIVSALGVYMGYVGAQINFPGFGGQVAVAMILAIAAIGAVVLERLNKDNEKRFLIARVVAAVSLVGGLLNALFI